MLPNFLFPEQVVREKNGEGAAVSLDGAAGTVLQLTLGITEVKEQQSLDVLIFGSPDGVNWSPKPLTSFPQKFYKGVWTILMDLSSTPEIRHLRVNFKTNR